MARRRTLGIVIVVVGLLGAASISVDRERTITVTGPLETPVGGVYVVFHHRSYYFNPVDSVSSRVTRRVVARTDAAGQVRVPAKWHVHWPFPIQSHPHLVVELVYSHDLHNGLATFYGAAQSNLPGFEVAADLSRIRLSDLTGDPSQWQGTLANLGTVIQSVAAEREPWCDNPSTTSLTRELLEDFASDYLAFLERYGQVRRPFPAMPVSVRYGTDEDRRRWREMVAQDLSREPLWGDVAVRLHEREIASLRRTLGDATSK